MAMKPCSECRKEISSKAKACPYCGAPNKQKSSGCGAIIFGGLVVIIIAYVTASNDSSKKNLEQSEAVKETSISPQEHQQGADEKSKTDLETFKKTLEAVGIDNKLISGLGVQKDTILINVANDWHYQPYQIRLQAAQNLWVAWARIHSPAKPDSAYLKLTDNNGNEVGGSGMMGGSTVWVKKD